jgi:radical SAM protein with 4Fe4S-binding SPASM domain
MDNKSFCIYPWIHMYVNPDGSVLPCCVGEYDKHLGNVRENTIEEIWNNDRYKQLRRNMLEGKKCDTCRACYQQEDSGNESTRISKNKEFAHLIPLVQHTLEDGTYPEMTLRHFDVRWSNICNFKCRSCSSTYSSTWAQEDSANGKHKEIFIMADGDDNSRLYEQFKPYFKDIESFYFAGGEPLMTDKHYAILEHLIETNNTDVKISYNTNLSNLHYKNKSVIELWKHFPNIQVFASLDHYGDRAEYIREGTNWSKIENNIKLIKRETPHVRLNFSAVISAFNVFTITDFLDYVLEQKLFDTNVYPTFYNIVHPEYYSASILNDMLKWSVINKIKAKSHKYNAHVQGLLRDVVRHLENSKYDENLKEQFIVHTDYYDKIRNRNFEKTFPELREIIE